MLGAESVRQRMQRIGGNQRHRGRIQTAFQCGRFGDLTGQRCYAQMRQQRFQAHRRPGIEQP